MAPKPKILPLWPLSSLFKFLFHKTQQRQKREEQGKEEPSCNHHLQDGERRLAGEEQAWESLVRSGHCVSMSDALVAARGWDRPSDCPTELLTL